MCNAIREEFFDFFHFLSISVIMLLNKPKKNYKLNLSKSFVQIINFHHSQYVDRQHSFVLLYTLHHFVVAHLSFSPTRDDNDDKRHVSNEWEDSFNGHKLVCNISSLFYTQKRWHVEKNINEHKFSLKFTKKINHNKHYEFVVRIFQSLFTQYLLYEFTNHHINLPLPPPTTFYDMLVHILKVTY